MQYQNPWGYPNHELLTIYQGASQDGECPLVVDTSTPSCGDSRFGCWVCTLVEEDKSMQAMIQNDAEKDWMQPLLDVRNLLDNPLGKRKEERSGTGPDDREVRDFRRMSGLVQIYQRKTDDSQDRVADYVPGPYEQDHRAALLRQMLRAQCAIRENERTPKHVRGIELISLEELRAIRRIWVLEKHETEDLLPRIYQEELGSAFPDPTALESSPWGPEEFEDLRATSANDLQYEMLRELLHVEQRYRTAARRSGLYEAIEDAIRRSFYDDEEDAIARARRRHEALHPDSAGEAAVL
jgi:DNA sulfur modification protein DndC